MFRHEKRSLLHLMQARTSASFRCYWSCTKYLHDLFRYYLISIFGLYKIIKRPKTIFILWWYMVVGQALYPPTLGSNWIHYHLVMWLSHGENDGHQHDSGERFWHVIFLNIGVKVWKCGTVLLLMSSIYEPMFIKQMPPTSAWRPKMMASEDLWR